MHGGRRIPLPSRQTPGADFVPALLTTNRRGYLMKRTLVAVGILAFVWTGLARAQTEVKPTRSPEVERMGGYIGDWSFQETSGRRRLARAGPEGHVAGALARGPAGGVALARRIGRWRGHRRPGGGLGPGEEGVLRLVVRQRRVARHGHRSLGGHDSGARRVAVLGPGRGHEDTLHDGLGGLHPGSSTGARAERRARRGSARKAARSRSCPPRRLPWGRAASWAFTTSS